METGQAFVYLVPDVHDRGDLMKLSSGGAVVVPDEVKAPVPSRQAANDAGFEMVTWVYTNVFRCLRIHGRGICESRPHRSFGNVRMAGVAFGQLQYIRPKKKKKKKKKKKTTKKLTLKKKKNNSQIKK
eukprot:NODE_22419_length_709_cov_2.666667.p1 GENE.NODE_22419_length_709_cov_2.666667~~NODE_22419_length_709_cov_2.666667.p1  ORF type:complete len:128 (-),score=43.47 NODE_22419_length_709_cov_2.666667:21-404(-)